MTRIKSIFGFLLMALVFGIIVFGGPQAVSAQTDKAKDTVKTEKDDDKDCGEKLSPEDAKKAKITMEEARAIALKRVGGKIVEEDLEKEDGRLQYAFDIRTSDGKLFDVEIDAETGEILYADEDGKDPDDKDSAKENKVVVKKVAKVKKD